MESQSTNFFSNLQARLNRSTRTHWDYFASHRKRLEELLLPDEANLYPIGRKICVLGAGNCNDVNLPRLIERFEQVHLVDLDAATLERAVERQKVHGDPRMHLHAPVDLTGIADPISVWHKKPPTPTAIDTVLRQAAEAPHPQFAVDFGPFDVVLSPCILSQITGYACNALGRQHPRCNELRRAVRQRFLRLMVDLLPPLGAALLISDMATGATPESLTGTSRNDLGDLVNKVVGQGRSFTGLDPDSVRDGFLKDPRIGPLIGDLQFIRPWVWTLGPEKAFLVFAMRVRRSAGTMLLSTTPS